MMTDLLSTCILRWVARGIENRIQGKKNLEETCKGNQECFLVG